MKFTKFSLFIVLAACFSCTDLKETLNEDYTEAEALAYINDNADVDASLSACYAGLRTFMTQDRIWCAQQHTSDETLGPTRGPDWDDNGIWRVLHSHNWTAEHAYLNASFDELLQVVFNTTNTLTFKVTPQQDAEARFIRAFVLFNLADLWDQVPYRDPGENLLKAPRVLKGEAALALAISEIEAIQANLPDGPAHKANKNAAKALLARMYLNKGTIASRKSPRFDAADMAKVIANCDAVIASAKYSVEDNYFDNFAPNNDAVSSENIWTGENRGGISSGNVRSRWFCGLHYNHNPSGWNGFTTLSDFYNSFEDSDVRKKASYSGMTDVSGINAGFLSGQQFDQTGTALKDRKGNPLSFTGDVKSVETGDNLEVTGIRVIKYPIDYKNGDNSDNDYVFLRYADVLLMKAEAHMRSGDAAGGLAIVNDLRAKRGATALSALTADDMLKERGRELYWEGNRRSDMIRFGKFLAAFQEKPASGDERLIFPIPASALASNPNLSQNPGY